MIILKFQVKTPVSMLTAHWANNLPNMFQNFQTLPGSSRFQNRLRTNKLISESNSTHSNRIDRISLTYHVFRSIYIFIYIYIIIWYPYLSPWGSVSIMLSWKSWEHIQDHLDVRNWWFSRFLATWLSKLWAMAHHGTCPDFLSNSTGWFRRK